VSALSATPADGGSDDATLPTPDRVAPPLGIVENLPHETYLHEPALSVSGMRMLLPPNCPALFRHYQDNRRPSKRAYDFGHVVHGLVLGDGPEIVRIDAADWRTKAAKDERDEAYSVGKVPILSHEYDEAAECAASVLAHTDAGPLFTAGRAEVSLFWTDPETDVKMRGRLDWLREEPGQRVMGVDLKTSVTADPESFGRSAANYGYAQQQAMYEDAIRATGLHDDPEFRFVVVEKSAPYLVSVIELDPEAVRIGRSMNQKAALIYKRCMETGEWPGYADNGPVLLPFWWMSQNEEEMSL
jgi:hypothetical protein